MDDVQPYKFGKSEPNSPVSLTGMDRLGERLARRVRGMLEPVIGVKPIVTAQNGEMVNYDLWSAMVPGFGAFSTYKLHPLKGMVLVRLDPAMIWAMVDRYYGGSGTRPAAADRNEFTPSEERIYARIADGVMNALVQIWSDLLPMEMAPVARESDPQLLVFADSNEQLLSQSFTLSMEEGSAEWTMELLFPHLALKQLEPLFSTHLPEETGPKDPLWQARIARRMGEITLPAKTVLARPSLTLAELLNLKNGDIIPVNIGGNLPLIVGNRLLAVGSVGEQNGHAAFKIEKMSEDLTA